MATPPPIPEEPTPAQTMTLAPTRTPVIIESRSILEEKYGPLLIAGVVFISLVIIITIVAVGVVHCRKKRNQIYAEDDNPSDDNDAGNVDILSVYKLHD